MARGTRIWLALILGGGMLLAVMGVVLMAAAVLGYRDWDTARRLIAFGMGACLTVVITAWLGLVWRQQVLGEPQVHVVAVGLRIGPDLIPWAEVDDVAPFRVFGLAHVALVQAGSAPKRLRGIGRVHYQTRGGRRFVFLAERQLGQDVATAAANIRASWLRYRLEPGTDPVTDATGEHTHA